MNRPTIIKNKKKEKKRKKENNPKEIFDEEALTLFVLRWSLASCLLGDIEVETNRLLSFSLCEGQPPKTCPLISAAAQTAFASKKH